MATCLAAAACQPRAFESVRVIVFAVNTIRCKVDMCPALSLAFSLEYST